MALTLDTTNIVNSFQEILENEMTNWGNCLMEGDLLGFEEKLRAFTNLTYDKIAEVFLQQICSSEGFKNQLKLKGEEQKVKHLKKRDVQIQIGTGSWVKFPSFYAYKAESEQNRHVGLDYLGCIKKASPAFYSLASLLSVMSPSFYIGSQLLDNLGITACTSRIMKLSYAVGKKGRQLGIKGILAPNETWKGKRIVIQLDGGRSRLREYNGEINDKSQPKYNTPWREPKVMLAQVIDDEGNIEREETLPLYFATMEDCKTCLAELTTILKIMKAKKAKEIQFVADGARTIWANIRQAFFDAGIKPSKITYTLDYFHAVEHISSLVSLLPPAVKQEEDLFIKWKGLLWNGSVYSIRREFKELVGSKLTQEMKTELNYFKKHHDRMQYSKFRKRKLLCGSGLIESAIRRIINLRFKSASSFWIKENLEQLIFLRGTFLAGRWKFLIRNLANGLQN